jgi:probable phosphoglycerate mutase
MVRRAIRLVYLSRHGETDWNAAGRWQGHTDVPLNENGYRQAHALGEALRGTGVVSVVTSDLLRAHETGRIAAQRIGVSIAYRDAGLRERAFGPFEGLTRDECHRLHPAEWRAWLEDQRAPPGAEERSAVAARMTAAIDRAASAVAQSDGAVLVVSHGGAALATVLGVPPPPIANGAIWRLEWDGRIVRAEAVEKP